MKRVYLEITDACNLRCPFCTYEKKDHFMPLQQIDDYTDQIRPLCDYLYLHILGEPLLHPDFSKILDLLDEKGFKVQLVSNGTLLHRYPDLLSHPCLRKLSISLHSYDYSSKDPSYFKTIDELIEKDSNVTIELRFYNKEHLSKQLIEYRDALIERFGIKATKRKNSFCLKENVYLYEEELFDWPKICDPVLSEEGTCHGGIDMIAINHEGKVGLCCLDPVPCNLLGDLNKKSLAEILQGKVYLDIVEGFKKRKVIADLCKRCSYRLRF
ncbi:MAG: radical SAM protein [Erysipelotrichaceae bacterium]|nr:radical SAM protein [Erysipelotrichaceae bacterium]